MKRKWFIASCWLALCVIFVFEYVLVVSSILQYVSGKWCGSSDDDVVAQSQVEKLQPPVINRKIPSPPHRKMLQAPTVARHVASQIESEERMNLLAACTADASSDPASRAMAVQLCGERRVRSSRPALEAISGIPSIPAVLRLSARRALALIDGKELAQ